MQLLQRGARRASLALAIGLTGLATCTAAASAASNASFYTGTDGGGGSFYSETDGGAPHVDLVRGGTVLASADGYAFSGGTFAGTSYPPARFADVSLPNNGTLVAGDQLQVTMDGGTQTFTYDGTPTINADACNGASTFTGGVAAGATKLEASGWMSGMGSANGD